MSQRKKEQTKTNGTMANDDHVVDPAKMAALQKYRDTEGHFSLVRCVVLSPLLEFPRIIISCAYFLGISASPISSQ